MLGGAIIGLTTGIARSSYDATMSAGVCGVAYVHYSMMIKVRYTALRASYDTDEKPAALGPLRADALVSLLRYSDWFITMPLLALKILNLARDGATQASGFLEGKYIPTTVASLAMAMILAGYMSSALYGERGAYEARIGLFLIGLVCLVLIYVILFFTALESDSKHTNEVFGFGLFWTTYPLVFLLDLAFELEPSTKDVAYSVLDTVSKPFLTLYVVVHTFEVA